MNAPAVRLLLLCAALAGLKMMNAAAAPDAASSDDGRPLFSSRAKTYFPDRAYFILPEGKPFGGPDFTPCCENGNRPAGGRGPVLLRFADELSIVDELLHECRSWFACERDGVSFFLPESHITFMSKESSFDADGNLPIGRGLSDPRSPLPLHYEPSDLETVPPRFGVGGSGRVLLLRKEAREHFISLIEDAEREGIVIRILSAYRSARYQSGLYMNAISARGPYQNSVAKPGHSEHQLGTACDLTTDEIRNGLSPDFEGTRAFRWIRENGHRYGIYLSYPKFGTRVTGYVYEPWHFRYYGSLRWSGPVEEGRVFFAR